MKKTLLSGSVAALIAVSSAVLAPSAHASAQPTPGELGGTCTVEGQQGQSLKIVGTDFEIEGTATVANYGDTDLPLTQTLKEGKTKEWNVGGSVDFDLLKLFHVSLSSGYKSSQAWEVGQTLGPYPVKPGYTGVLQYGFLNQKFEGTHLSCQGGKWVDAGRPFWGTIPKERHVRVSMRTNESDRSVDGAKPQVTEFAV
ncbi:hypothetical protein [Corynebacterium lactis]|uniref:Secreted protein n=1 Tax=Corynebacterium lactis RW2-5 TaxID=1408189 RepID=A0A0K2H397_9CORY|nr:hypothetical protein [Corynebacterium lactis]ALA68186.1 hypothetical protein CLAC_11455 [Corynebacterium lactis RW2-5]